MIAPRKTDNESERLKALKSYQILDSLPEIEYDDLTKIASQICNVPITLISLIDQDRQWFKSKVGLNAEETSREISFCGHAILDPQKPLIVEDASKDKRFVANPLVTGTPNIAFYAGIPLVDHDGFALGTLCAIDEKPRQLNFEQIESLKALGRQVVQLLELRRSKLALEEKNEYLNKFSTIAAHDLKAPIHNINLLGHYLLDINANDYPAGAFEMIQQIQFCADKMTGLINGLLEYSRKHEDILLQYQMIKVSGLITDLEQLLVHNTEGKIIWTSEIEQIYSHPTLILQVLSNLVSNGIKYNDKATPLIQLHFAKIEKYYQIEIKDNGPGIDPKNQLEIFAPFVVMANKDRFGNKGHGLGLATVQKIINSMQGEITLTSELTKGTTFTLRLPAQQ